VDVHVGHKDVGIGARLRVIDGLLVRADTRPAAIGRWPRGRAPVVVLGLHGRTAGAVGDAEAVVGDGAVMDRGRRTITHADSRGNVCDAGVGEGEGGGSTEVGGRVDAIARTGRDRDVVQASRGGP